jgi:hypothetical protein
VIDLDYSLFFFSQSLINGSLKGRIKPLVQLYVIFVYLVYRASSKALIMYRNHPFHSLSDTTPLAAYDKCVQACSEYGKPNVNVKNAVVKKGQVGQSFSARLQTEPVTCSFCV